MWFSSGWSHVQIENMALIMASRMNPFIFLQQVRQETAKVTWPSRRETTISIIMVLVFAIIASIFFLAADQLIAYLVGLILNIGG
jgi:preprotein translocase subunit SecE